jgi:hypothetical protein
MHSSREKKEGRRLSSVPEERCEREVEAPATAFGPARDSLPFRSSTVATLKRGAVYVHSGHSTITTC